MMHKIKKYIINSFDPLLQFFYDNNDAYNKKT
jgi:hypothetical protein